MVSTVQTDTSHKITTLALFR